MKNFVIDNNMYELERNYKDAFNLEEINELYTDYFEPYDYIFGDYSYSKLRLKGFYEKNNKKKNKINDISSVDDYIKKYCAYDCKYFLLHKIKGKGK